MNDFYEIDRTCIFNDVEYRVIQLLDNNLMLTVVKEDLEKEVFPLQTFIIPDDKPHY
ncbi:MAG: hypothetical protein Q8936_23705 [Bacillota bacterium]|nr:hypothetical protein [Bacillota bacterium]